MIDPVKREWCGQPFFLGQALFGSPQLGSGRGSRGYAAVRKNELVRRAIREHKITSILDIGCGDLCWLDGEIAEACIYLGCDISEIIIERNFPARHVGVSSPRFTVHDIAADPLTATADLLICFDVLIHQIDKARFDCALRNIVSAIRKVALVSISRRRHSMAPLQRRRLFLRRCKN
jgi:SAM-dependent methyltransferase